MIINLPTIKRTPIEKDGELIEVKKEKVYIPFNLDTSAYADYRFEMYFSEQLKCTFNDYKERIAKIKTEKAIRANYTSILKLLYCLLESEKAPTYIDFIKMFDAEVAEEIFNKIHQVIKLSYSSAAKN